MSNGASIDRHHPLGSVADVTNKLFSADVAQQSLFELDQKPLILLASEHQPRFWVQFRVSAFAIARAQNEIITAGEVPELITNGGGQLWVSGPIVYEHCGDEIDYYRSAFEAVVRVTVPRRYERQPFLTGVLKLVPKSGIIPRQAKK